MAIWQEVLELCFLTLFDIIKVNRFHHEISNALGRQGESDIGSKPTGQGDFHIRDKKLTNFTPASDRMSAINKDYPGSTYLLLHWLKSMKNDLSFPVPRIEAVGETPYGQWGC